MMQEGYKVRGWLGLILGGSLYFAFFDSAIPTDEKFMLQMDALIGEIGERGKAKLGAAARVSEGVPPEATVLAATPPPAAPAPTMNLLEWLTSIKLETYADAIIEEGYEDLPFILELAEGDIDELAADVKMKKGHAKKFNVEWKKLG